MANNNNDIYRAIVKMCIKQARQITDDQEALAVKCLYKNWSKQLGRELIDDREEKTVYYLTNLAIHNMGGDAIHVIINGGDQISILGNEVMTCGDIKVYSLVIKESNAHLRYMGIQN